MAIADVNGDGNPDLVTANLASSDVSVLRGNGDGTFRTPQRFPTGVDPVFVAIADVNGDGRLDLVVANSLSNDISVLRGNGNGTFQTHQPFTAGTNPFAVAVADINSDGYRDVVVANRGSDDVSVLRGNGDGTFGTQQRFAAGSGPYSIAAADVDSDGRPDVVVANVDSNTVSVLRGNSNGTFQAQQTFAAGIFPTAVAVADVNGDNRLDLSVASLGGTVSVLLNGSGTGTLSGTPAVGTGGTYVLTFTATNGVLPDATQLFTLNVDGAPTDITLSPASAAENQPAGTLVGTLTALDPNTGDTHTFDLVAGTGSTDNASFQIVGDQLLTNAVFDFEVTPSLSIRVQATDSTGLTFEKALTILVTNVSDAPVVTTSGGVTAFTEDGGAVTVDKAVTVTDMDSTTLTEATVTITNLLDTGLETLTATPVGTVLAGDITYTAPTLTITKAGGAPLADMQAVLQSVTYNNTAQNPDTTARVLEFVANDGTAASSPATKTVTVAAVNDEPTLDTIPDPPAIFEDTGLQTVNLSGIAPGGGEIQNLTVTATSSNPGLIPDPTVTYTSPGATGSLRYTPVADQNGSAVITVTVMDDGGTANPGDDDQVSKTFTVPVTDINDEPSFTTLGDQVVNEDSGLHTVSSFASPAAGGGSDESGQTFTYNVSDNNGALFSIPPAINSSGQLRYTLAPNANGQATVTVSVSDSGGTANPGDDDTSPPQTFTITVTSVNDTPVAVADATSVAEGGTVTILTTPPAATSVLANDSDPDLDTLTVTTTPVSGPTNGSLTLSADGTFSYTHNGGETSTDSFDYEVCDNGSPVRCANATVSITITPVNDAPTAADDSATVNEGGTVMVLDSTAASVRANDTDPDNLLTALTVNTTPVTPPGNGILTLNANGTFSYTHDGDETTSDSFVYEICDPAPLCATATVNITINPSNDAPLISLPGGTAAYDSTTATPVILDATATVTDVDSPDLDTGVLTVNITTDCEDTDRLDVVDQGIGVGEISVVGATVRYNFGGGPLAIGTIATEFDCTTPVPSLTITLNANATPVAARALLRQISFFSTVSTPIGTSRTIEVFLTDGDGGTSNTASTTVTIDASPTVATIVPANNASGVALTANVVITFSEAVDVTGNWFQIACPTSGTRDALSGTGVSVNPAFTVYTINPTADFANGEVCVVTITATLVADQDVIDPPDTMAADFTSNFTSVNNSAPSFTIGADQTVNEDVGPQTVDPWATAIDDGDGNTQTLTFNVTGNTNAALFSAGPAISATGILTYTPAANANGAATITLMLRITAARRMAASIPRQRRPSPSR